MANSSGKSITVGITGASGAIYAQAVLRLLDADPSVERVFLVSTETGMRLLATELGVVPSESKKLEIGAIYAQAVLRLLDADPSVERVFLVSTETGMRLLATELGVVPSESKKL